MKYLLLVLVSSLFLSGCSKDTTLLMTQTLEFVNPKTNDEMIVVSKAPVKVTNIPEYGNVLVTKTGKPLYVKSGDSASVSTCYDDCAIAWPPLIVQFEGDVSGDYGILTRSDGTLQVTRFGMPLYSYVPDKVRIVTGDGYKGMWKVVTVEVEEE